MSNEKDAPTFTIPARADDALTGSQFAAQVMDVPLGPDREEAIFQQLSTGNIPDFLRASRTIVLSASSISITVEVLPDVLCVGMDDDFVRVPMNPKTAQRVADLFGASLITQALSDAIWRQADVRIDALRTTMPPCSEMTSTRWFVDQNDKVEHLRASRTGLIAGHKKDVVLANTLSRPEFKDNRVAIYGWHKLTGAPIQSLNPMPTTHLTHEITYADYSHGIRLIAANVTINDDTVPFVDAAQNPLFAPLLNCGGVLTYLRYPTA
jgi:hypothetical protein